MSMGSALPARAFAALVAAGVGLLMAASPSHAHTDFIGSDPQDGANLRELPREIRLEFSEQMDAGLSAITVRQDDSRAVRLDTTAGSKATELVASMPASLTQDGGTTSTWTVSFRVVSRDGHPVSGSTTFTVRTPATPVPAPAPDTETTAPESPASEAADPRTGSDSVDQSEDKDMGIWLPLIIGLGVLLVLLTSVATFIRRVGRDRNT